MTIFDVLNLIGGIALFLFGMHVMSQALEKVAGNSLKVLIARFTTNRFAGLLTGLAATALLQSSAATTVMVVGFVNSGLMTLSQSITVIMGANVGTTVTAWILSLSGISGTNFFVEMLKPTSFTPILGLIGIILYLRSKTDRKRNIGLMLLGFTTLMTGMTTMSSSASGLQYMPGFQELFILFKNPVLGVIAGAVLTAIVQSSAASVGILQALATTGAVTNGAAIAIVMGQNIGTTTHALFSSVGANKNARRTALVHLCFNLIGTVSYLVLYLIVNTLLHPLFFEEQATIFGVALIHSAFNVFCVCLLFPFSKQLEKLVCRLVPDSGEDDIVERLDERLLGTPIIALDVCGKRLGKMAYSAVLAVNEGLDATLDFDEEKIEDVRLLEDKTDHYEDAIYDFLIKLSSKRIGEDLSAKAAEYMKHVGDFERLADHGLNLAMSAEEIHDKKIVFSPDALADLTVIYDAVREIMDLAYRALTEGDMSAAVAVEPLSQNINILKEQIRSRHIERLQKGECSVDAGFVLNDILTGIERAGDHCSNIAICILENRINKLDMHGALREIRANAGIAYREKFKFYHEKYHLAPQDPEEDS